MNRHFRFAIELAAWSAYILPGAALAQASTAGTFYCSDNPGKCPTGNTRSSPNAAASTINSIQQNLQRQDQIINNATDQVLQSIQQNQTSDQGATTNTTPSDSGSDQMQANVADQQPNSIDNAPEAAAPSDAPSGVAADVSNMLGNGDESSAAIAAGVSNAVTGNAGAAGVAENVSSVLDGSINPADRPSELSVSAADMQQAEAAVTQPTDPAQVGQQLASADEQVLQPNPQQAQSDDAVTQATEAALTSQEQTPTLGGWIMQKLEDNLPSALYAAQGQATEQLAQASSGNPVEQASNKIFLDAGPGTGLAPAIASSPGNAPEGLYNYLNRLVNDANQLLHGAGTAFGLIVTPDGDQQ